MAVLRPVGGETSERRVIAIGGSSGAISAVKSLCGSLPVDLPAAICIVIHVGARGRNLVAGIFDDWCPIPVQTAADGQELQNGRAYVAPADRHLIVVDRTIRLGHGPRENLARPAIDPLMRSAGLSHGAGAIGVVLTGLLNDGAAGLADLKRCGGITIVQNPTEAAERDMPLAAIAASDIDYRVPIAELGSLLAQLTGRTIPPSPLPSEDIRLEVEIALGRPAGSESTELLAAPVPLSCPACGGVLSEIWRSPPLRFRCQVGHAYTAEALAHEHESSVDEALRVALRIVEERAVLTRKMAEEARRNGRKLSAASLEQAAVENRNALEILRRALVSLERDPKSLRA